MRSARNAKPNNRDSRGSKTLLELAGDLRAACPSRTGKPLERLSGEQLLLPAMQHAPSNEAGVMVLFGMLAQRMGFIIEQVGTRFPDCIARLAIDGGWQQWRRLRIEFEYRSSNFQQHRHPPEGCDLIVCWEHDWRRCPVEVLPLRWVVKEFAAHDEAGWIMLEERPALIKACFGRARSVD